MFSVHYKGKVRTFSTYTDAHDHAQHVARTSIGICGAVTIVNERATVVVAVATDDANGLTVHRLYGNENLYQ